MVLSRNVFILVVLCYCFTQTVKSKEEGNYKGTGNRTETCGITNAPSTRNASKVRIIPAQEAEKGAWPWMAEIYITRRNESRPTCPGALLNHFYVLSSAHCFHTRGQQLNTKDVTVVLGDHNLKSEKDGMKPINSSVTAIDVHSEFDPVTFANDIALLRLEHSVAFDSHIQPICLPENEDLVKNEDQGQVNGYVAGWGSTSFHGPTSDVLQEMSAIITFDEVCRKAYEGMAIITDGNICSVGINGSSPCQGFGGAPVVLPGKDNRYHVVGIVSFGRGCGDPEFPDVHTRVSQYLDWIAEYVI